MNLTAYPMNTIDNKKSSLFYHQEKPLKSTKVEHNFEKQLELQVTKYYQLENDNRRALQRKEEKHRQEIANLKANHEHEITYLVE